MSRVGESVLRLALAPKNFLSPDARVKPTVVRKCRYRFLLEPGVPGFLRVLVSRAHGIKALSCTRQGGLVKTWLKMTLISAAVTFAVAAGGTGHNDVTAPQPATGWCAPVQIPVSLS